LLYDAVGVCYAARFAKLRHLDGKAFLLRYYLFNIGGLPEVIIGLSGESRLPSRNVNDTFSPWSVITQD
jgi:hypothetical protein